MGQARIKQLLAQAAAATALPKPDPENLGRLAEAMHRVVGAITGFYGADCLPTSLIGAEVLRSLGYDAQAVAGSAAWRVGLGDGDVVNHAMEMHAPDQAAFKPNSGNLKAAMFHSWIEVAGQDVVDFTTASLRHKAAALDAMDGGKTQVDWAPSVLWVPRSSCRSFKEVAKAYEFGLYAYRRHAIIEDQVLGDARRRFEAVGPAQTVLMAYDRLRKGEAVRVLGVGQGDEPLQSLDSAKQHSVSKGFVSTKFTR